MLATMVSSPSNPLMKDADEAPSESFWVVPEIDSRPDPKRMKYFTNMNSSEVFAMPDSIKELSTSALKSSELSAKSY